ncbi:MAG TPA: ABC transporter permease [Chryseosolibacter sp.]
MNSVRPSTAAQSWEITPDSYWFRWRLKELWEYRHLLLRLVRRDFLIHHQQTLLGPLWIIFQPLIMLVMYMLIFEKAVGLSTDGLPPALFYLSGIILYNLFAECFSGTSFTFLQNGTLFGKVYFPRLVIPLAVVVVNLIRFGIQFLIFMILLAFMEPGNILQYAHRWVPSMVFAIIITSGVGLGLGLMFSILTAKYRDLVNVIHLIVRLLMFATPIIYPISMVDEKFRMWVYLNPLSSLVEYFRFGFLGQGTFSAYQLIYSAAVAVILNLIGIMLFNKYGNKLQDVI